MDAREERGLAIAAKYNLTKKGDAWLVPSQSENGGILKKCVNSQAV